GYGDRHGDGKAHRTQTSSVKKTLGVQSRTCKQIDLNSRSRVADNQFVFRLDFGADHLCEVEYRDRSLGLAVFFCDHWVASLPIGTTRVPRRMIRQSNSFPFMQELR